MHGRMITVVISEILMGNIDIASHNFLEPVFKEPPGKRLVFFHGHWTFSLLGDDGEIWGFPGQRIPTATQRSCWAVVWLSGSSHPQDCCWPAAAAARGPRLLGDDPLV